MKNFTFNDIIPIDSLIQEIHLKQTTVKKSKDFKKRCQAIVIKKK